MAQSNGPWKMYIDGKWVDSKNRREVISPATGEPFTDVPEADTSHIDMAVAAAKRAQGPWGRKSPVERAEYMRRIVALLKRDTEQLAQIITREMGKPISEARGEAAGGAVGFIEYYMEMARRIQGEVLPSDVAEEQIIIQRVPAGVVAAIIPWNYPAALVSRKVGPALIAGCTVVLKPHEMSPLSALFMAQLFDEAGLPPGVVNVVTGQGETVGAHLSRLQDVDLISMTGSVPTGRKIMIEAAKNLKPVSLELGGKAPFIVMDDANIDLAVKNAITSRFMNCGQVCIANERTLVHQDVYQDFVDRFVAMAKTLRVGDPTLAETDIGPKVSLEELEKVEAMVEEAKKGGVKVLMGGGRPSPLPTPKGYWYSATVLTGASPDMPIMQKEIFGPVVPIVPFKTFEEAVKISNDSAYGLSAYLFTNDFQKVMRSMRDVDFGELYINRVGPESLQGFHIGYRNSGLGGDDGIHGLDAYLKKKTCYLNYGDVPATAIMPYGRKH